MNCKHAFLLVLVSTALVMSGCHKTDVKDYIPPDEPARKALTAALDAWREGKALDQIGASNPKVEAQDIQWRDGKKLAAYEIVGPTTGDDQNTRFKVKLTIAGAAPQETTYVVVGKDPIWVFSEESYKRAAGQ